MAWTFAALGPLGPCSASYETFAPSASVLKPLPWMAEWWTKRSLPWSSGAMKPKPFSSLNHFTVPVAIYSAPPMRCAVLRNAGGAGQQLRTAGTAFTGLHCPALDPMVTTCGSGVVVAVDGARRERRQAD